MQEEETLRRVISSAALAIVVCLSAGCGSSLYRVKPVTELPALPDNSRSASAGGVTVRVAPFLTDEEAQELFEVNLPLAGVLPVRMEMAFESGIPVEIKRARFRLRDAQGREWKLLSPKGAVSRILKANEVFAYNPHSRKEFEKEFGSYAIELKEPLTDSDSRRQGFLFFQTPKGEPVRSNQGLVLTIERLPQPVELKLD
jgi:hypothetical protein